MESKFINACEEGDIKTVEDLLTQGVDPRVNNNRAIYWASENGHTEIVKLLLEDRRADPSNRNSESIQSASQKNYPEVVKLLLEDGRANPSALDNYAIQTASLQGHTKVVKLLLEDGRADPRADDNYAIRLASANGHEKIVDLLLQDRRANPSADDNYAIRIASQNGYIEIVEMFLNDGRADPSSNDNYAINLASAFGYNDIVLRLLQDSRVNPNPLDNNNISHSTDENILRLKLQMKDTLRTSKQVLERKLPPELVDMITGTSGSGELTAEKGFLYGFGSSFDSLLLSRPKENWDWYELSKKMSISFIRQNKTLPWVWEGVCENPSLEIEYVIKHPEIKWDYRAIARNGR